MRDLSSSHVFNVWYFPARVKSPAGLVKTPLSVLHLQPTDKPQYGLSSRDPAKDEEQSPPQGNSPEDDIVDGLVKEFQSFAPGIVPDLLTLRPTNKIGVRKCIPVNS